MATTTMTSCSADEGESSYPLHMMMKSSSQTRHPLKFVLEDPVIRTCPSTSSTARANKKRVVFDQRVHVRAIIACHDMSAQEIDAVWYSAEEFQAISESCCKQIMKLNRGEILKDKKHCARGLESHTHIRSLAKGINRNSARQVVFEEQERQLQQGIHNDEALSQVYLAASSGSCIWANVIGLEDQKEADNIYDDETL